MPTRLPFRGPADLPTPVTSSLGVDQLLEENNQMLLLTEEILKNNGDLTKAAPLMQRLQRNLVYLSLLADQSSTKNMWTKEEGEKLREAFRIYGDNSEKIAAHIGTKSILEVEKAMLQLKPSQ